MSEQKSGEIVESMTMSLNVYGNFQIQTRPVPDQGSIIELSTKHRVSSKIKIVLH